MKVIKSEIIKVHRQNAMPDIDTDIPTTQRDIVKEYISQRFGENYVCSIGTYTRMQLKTCLKDFGKIKGIPFDKMNILTKTLENQLEYTWDDLIRMGTQDKIIYRFIQQYPDIVHFTKFALGQPRASSVHASAVVIVPKVDAKGNNRNIFTWMPIKKIDGVYVSEWEGKYIDKSGFLKEDVLGLSQLDKFTAMLKLIKKNHNKDIILTELPLDDEDTYKAFQRGYCEDVFQFNGEGLKNYSKQAKPDNFDDLAAITSLFRPGAMGVNAHIDFVEFKRGKKDPKYDLLMEEITKDTQSLYIYQEQAMKAMVAVGMSELQADEVRVAMKKKDPKVMEVFKDEFIEKYSTKIENKVSDPIKYANKLWDKILSFSSYSFNLSHAVAYSYMSYWCQWLKVHYPLEFWTVCLQNSKEYEIPYRLAEIKKMGYGIEVSQPDINMSEMDFTCDVETNRIFFNIGKIKGIGEIAEKAILNVREDTGEFFSLEEFVERMNSEENKKKFDWKTKPANKKVISSLIISGAFDDIENLSSPYKRKKLLEQYFESKSEELPDKYNTKDSVNDSFWIYEQKNLTGFGEIDYMTLLKEVVKSKSLLRSYIEGENFERSEIGRQVLVVGRVIQFKEKNTKNGTMLSMNVDSNNTIIPITVWANCYENFKDKGDLSNAVIAFSGIVKKNTFGGNNRKELFSDNFSKIFIL